jgi:hypothetical protein
VQPFRFAAGGALPVALTAAGFRGVREVRRRVPQVWATSPERLARGFWDAPPPPFRGLLERLDREERERAVAESVEWFRRYAVDGRVHLEATVWLVAGTRPSDG